MRLSLPKGLQARIGLIVAVVGRSPLFTSVAEGAIAVEPHYGAVVALGRTQSWHRGRAMELLRSGKAPKAVLETMEKETQGWPYVQMIVADTNGDVADRSGERVAPHFGCYPGEGFAVNEL